MNEHYGWSPIPVQINVLGNNPYDGPAISVHELNDRLYIPVNQEMMAALGRTLDPNRDSPEMLTAFRDESERLSQRLSPGSEPNRFAVLQQVGPGNSLDYRLISFCD
jgi:hypothetical protein